MSASKPAGGRTLLIGGAVIAALSVGWFALSHFMMNTDTSDAIGEALGVALALLVVASVVGAITSGRGNPG